MPRYEEEGRSRRQTSRSMSPSVKERRSREPRSHRRDPSSSRERSSRSRREHKSSRHRSRSRSLDNASRRHRSHSSRENGHRHRHDRGGNDRSERSHRRRDDKRSTASSPSRRTRRHSSISPSRSASPRPSKRSKAPLPSQQQAFSKTPGDALDKTSADPETEKDKLDKQKPNFANTGRLAAETNTVRSGDGSASIVLKYHEPPEARKPPAKDPWRLYIFKDESLLETIELGDRSCWLIGREKFVADLSIEHPSCSKQHAALQFRYVEKRNEYGDRDGRVRPYLIDLESSNGTTVNGDPAPAGRYMELMDKDVLKFGLSTREYVLLLPPSG